MFQKIKTFIFDMDGVLTDGMVVLLPDGVQARAMNIKDGFALQMAIKKNYRVAIISGGVSPEAVTRLQKLGITDIFMGVVNKQEVLAQYIAQHELKKEEILFMGDDLPDAAAMLLTGLPCCPANAVEEVKNISLYISPQIGGQACVRDVIEKVLMANGDWNYLGTIASA